MKNYLLIAIICFLILIITETIFCQGILTVNLEIFMKTKDTGGATVTFQTTTESSTIWRPSKSNPIIDTNNWNNIADVVIEGDYTQNYKGWHTDGDTEWGMPSLGWAVEYTISVTNAGKYASFTVETLGYIENSDQNIIYDYDDDTFYYYGTQNEVLQLNMRDNVNYLQPTEPEEFICTNPNQSLANPHFTWSAPVQPPGMSNLKYKIYRAYYYGSFELVAWDLTGTSWTDEEVYIWPSAQTYFRYFVKAYTPYSPLSLQSEIVTVHGFN